METSFAFNTEYRFLYRDHSGQDVLLFANAKDDSEAVQLAKTRQHGLAVDIWQERRHVQWLPATIRIAL